MKWTRTETRLPEYGERVMLTRLLRGEETYVIIGHRAFTDKDGEHYAVGPNEQTCSDVVGWAELPMGVAIAHEGL